MSALADWSICASRYPTNAAWVTMGEVANADGKAVGYADVDEARMEEGVSVRWQTGKRRLKRRLLR